MACWWASSLVLRPRENPSLLSIYFHFPSHSVRETWFDEDDPDALLDTIEAYTEYLKERYANQQQTTPGPVSSLSSDMEETPDFMRRALFLEDRTQRFWRVKCRPGQESAIVFDIMQNNLPSGNHLIQSFDTTSAAQMAIDYIHAFACDPNGTIGEAVDQLKILLKLDPLPPAWINAIDLTVLDPLEQAETPLAGLERFEVVVPSLLSSITISKASSQSELQESVPRGSRMFSAFSAPDVAGFVYLEAVLGKAPQNMPLIDFLRLHPFIIKSTTPRCHPGIQNHKPRVWLEPVRSEEIPELLSTKPPPSIEPFTWVRVNNGLYKDDVGLVVRRELCSGLRRLVVLLVPRFPHLPRSDSEPTTPIGTKHKRVCDRHLQSLFDSDLHPNAKHIIDDNHLQIGKNEYHFDLLVAYLPYKSVTRNQVYMDNTTRWHFRASKHLDLRHVHLPACILYF
ncbi:hypothetical protein K435DRAFT_973095 [Dendrothele bispora CBS 962.96]|uniref:Uncharacterized protein n=1 Tax=Dendrothele bispora (strain CBS 962.96) TaxID=1314807 RepID=A0A4S8KUN6_DENBC|nr:hypothetical protein K435DRAFT_973095 [Dendrothele bispora CBS 962.96]